MKTLKWKHFSLKNETRRGGGFQKLVDLAVHFSNQIIMDLSALGCITD